MADEIQQAALRELARRELERRRKLAEESRIRNEVGSGDTLSHGFISQALSLPGQALDALQDQAKYVMGNIATGDVLSPGEAFGMAVAPETMMRAAADQPITPPAASLLYNRAFQGLNPIAAGSVGNEALESDPRMQRGAVDLEDKIGPGPAALSQLASQIAGAAPTFGAGGGAATGAESMGGALLRGSAGGVVTGAVLNALGAEKGSRVSSFVQGFDPTDPMTWANLAIGGLGGASGRLSAERAGREHVASVEKATETVQGRTPLQEIAEGREPRTIGPEFGTATMEPPTNREIRPGVPSPEVETNIFGDQRVEPLTQLDQIRSGRPLADNFDPSTLSPEERALYIRQQADQFAARLPTVVDETNPFRRAGAKPGLEGTGIDSPRAMERLAIPEALRELPSVIKEDLTVPRPADPAILRRERLAQAGEKTSLSNQNMLESMDRRAAMSADSGRAATPDYRETGGFKPGDKAMAADRMDRQRRAMEGPGAAPAGFAGKEPKTEIARPGETPNRKSAEQSGNVKTGINPPFSEPKTEPRTAPSTPPELGPEPKGGVWDQQRKNLASEAAADPRTLEPPRDPIPGKAVPVAPPAVQDAPGLFRRWVKTARSEFLKSLTLPEQRAAGRKAFEAAEAIRAHEGAMRLQDVQMAHLFPKLKAAARSAGRSGERMIERFIKQQLDPEGTLRTGEARIHPNQLPPEWTALWDEGNRQNRFYRDDLIRAGMFKPEQIMKMLDLEKKGFAWLHRDYRRFLDGTYLPRDSMISRALKVIQEKKPGLTSAEAAAYLYEIWDNYSPGASREQRFRQSRLNKEILKERSGIPPVFRDLLGEIHDGPFVFASSMSEIERLWRQHKVSKFYTDPKYKGQVWSDRPAPNMSPKKIWIDGASLNENRRMFGEFAGKYVAPELYETILQAPSYKQKPMVMQVVGSLMQMFKFAKVGLSPVAWARDATSNATSLAAAGLPVWNPRTGGRIVQAVRAVLDYGESFSTRKGPKGMPKAGDSTWLQWAYEDSAIRPGMGAEFAAGGRAKAIARSFLKDRSSGIFGLYEKVAQHAEGAAVKLGEIRELADTVPRLAAYIEQVTKGLKSGMDLGKARARASRIVNENFISSGNVGHGTREMARFAGVLNPFMTWYADAIRVHGNWLRNALEPAQGGLNGGLGRAQMFNVMGHYAMIASAFTAMRYLYGMSDQEVAAGEASLKTGFSKFHPFREWLPFRDSKGRAQVMPLSSLIPTSTFLQGNPENNPIQNLIGSMVTKPFEGGILEDWVNRSLKKFGLDTGYFQPRDPIPGTEGRQLLQEAWDFMSPGIVQQASDAARRAQLVGDLRKNEEPLTIPQALSKLTPFPVEPVGARSAEARRQESRGDVAEAQRVMKQINKSGPSQVPPEDRQKLQAEERRRIEDAQKRTSKRDRAYRGGK